MKAVAAYLGLKRNLVLLLAAIVTIGAGEEIWMRFLPKYLESVGASALVIGLFDALKTLLGAVYAYPGGALVDRCGHRRALIFCNATSVLGYAIVLSAPRWETVIAGMFFFLAWSTLSLPANFTLVAENLSARQHTMGIGVQSLIRRVPVLIGPVVGGALIDRWGMVGGVRIGLAISIGLGLASVLIQSGITGASVSAPSRSGGFLGVVRRFDPRLKRLLFSDILIRFCERIPFAWVVIYAMDHGGVTAIEVGILTTVEMLTAVACYVPVARLADRHGREPFVIATFVFFTAFPLALLGARGFAWLALAFCVRGLKEFGEPARKSLIIGYADPANRGRAIGAYYLIRDTVVSAGGLLGAALWSISPEVNLLSAAALGAAGAAVYAATLRRTSARASS